MTHQANWQQIKFTDDDLINEEEYEHGPGPHYNKLYLIHDHGFTVALVFARHEQDALDAAVDADKLDGYMIEAKDLDDYGPDAEGVNWLEAGISYLGNASEPFDIQTLDIIELPSPPFSFVALFNAMNKEN